MFWTSLNVSLIWTQMNQAVKATVSRASAATTLMKEQGQLIVRKPVMMRVARVMRLARQRSSSCKAPRLLLGPWVKKTFFRIEGTGQLKQALQMLSLTAIHRKMRGPLETQVIPHPNKY